ncbi:pilus assembly protein PilM [Kiritimatiellaeota bacterium B1221]|nr:pilus assembly protein PilM [Kiritimatiellaeota bacterium B1221]
MSKRILTLDVGASTLKLAEFHQTKDHQLELVKYGIRAVGIDPGDEANRMVYTGTALQELMQELRIKPGPVLLSLSGMHVFSRYVKLPPVSGDKISQVVEYEAKQNIPNLDEVVWDRQILTGREGDMDVLLAAVKQQVVEDLSETVHSCGLETELVDVSVASIYNAYRNSYPDAEGCTMILDMGAKTTNLIFAEGEQVWSRSFPVSGNSISQSIANDFNLEFGEAEALKEKVSMVALGGAYEPLEDPQADAVSKCIRGSMTRLHSEISRSINTYRSQQHGTAPQRVLLTGGSVVMSYFDMFLSEKLDVPVEYFNPLESVVIGNAVDDEAITSDWHLLCEVVGLAQRKAGSAIMQMNLLPPSIVRERNFRKKQGVFALCFVMVVAILGVWGWYNVSKLSQHRLLLGELESEVSELEGWQRKIDAERSAFVSVGDDLMALTNVVHTRSGWARVLKAVEENLPEGVWITQIRPDKDMPKQKIVLIGSFYKDELYEQWDRPDNEPIGEFQEALSASGVFGEETRFTRSVTSLSDDNGEYADQLKSIAIFQIEIELKNPVEL